jgi:hypothetical protein
VDAVASLRELLGTTLTLVQGELRADCVINALEVRVADETEDTRVQVETLQGEEYVVHLAPGEWNSATWESHTMDGFLPYQPVALEWAAAVTEPLGAATRRARPSALAE